VSANSLAVAGVVEKLSGGSRPLVGFILSHESLDLLRQEPTDQGGTFGGKDLVFLNYFGG